MQNVGGRMKEWEKRGKKEAEKSIPRRKEFESVVRRRKSHEEIEGE